MADDTRLRIEAITRTTQRDKVDWKKALLRQSRQLRSFNLHDSMPLIQ